VGALQRIGFDQLPAVQRLRRQLGGIDPFNPAILAAPGIDVAAPLVLSLFEPAGPNQMHTRIAATLRDPQTFTTFVDAVAASGQVKLARVDAASPLGKLGVVATGNLSPDVAVVIRVHEADAVLDLVNTLDGKKAPAPAELPRRFALAPARAFAVERGARRLFAPEAAAVAYVDARRMQPLLQALQADDARVELRWAQPEKKAAVLAKQRAREKKCAVWSRAPATFDDAALALTATPDGLTLTWAWGTQAGAPLGGLKLRPVDDAGLDADLLGREATAVVALYAASLSPFAALKHAAPFTSTETLSAAIDACDSWAGASLLLRSWPLALAAVAASKVDAASPMAALRQSAAGLRNVVLALRDVTQAGPRGAIAATLDAGARHTIETLLASVGATGAVTTIGKRSPTIFPLSVPGLPRQLAAALESLAAGRVGFTVADSDESLSWAYRTAQPPASAPAGDPSASRPPILRVAADMAALARLGPLLNAGRDGQQLLELLAHLRRVDGELVADGDLFRLTLRSPLKQ
ncbi:MAG TPA: hypothetical protein VF945_04525, partial [Polyangia bacterium]